MTVVGVRPELRYAEPHEHYRTKEGMFAPIAQQPIEFPRIMVRTAGDPLALAEPVRTLVSDLDLDIPVAEINTLESPGG